MNTRPHEKLDFEGGWSPHLSLEDAEKLDEDAAGAAAG